MIEQPKQLYQQLSALLVYLSQGSGASAAQICAHFGCDRRTLSRWLTALQNQYGALLTCAKATGNTKLYRIDPQAGLREASGRASLILHGLAPDEILLLIIALSGLNLPQQSSLAASRQALQIKLELLKEPFRHSTNRPPESWIIQLDDKSKAQQARPQVLMQIIQALSQSKACHVHYQSVRSPQVKDYRIDPIGLFEWYGGLYVLASRTDSPKPIPFALERFHHVSVLADPAIIPANFDAAAYLRKAFNLVLSEPMDNIQVWFDPSQAPYAKERRWGENQHIQENADGSCIVSFDSNGASEVLRWVLGFGPHAKALSPPQLCSMVTQAIQSMAAQYSP